MCQLTGEEKKQNQVKPKELLVWGFLSMELAATAEKMLKAASGEKI